MKKYENENIIIYYNDIDEQYINNIIEVLSSRIKKIMNFFKLTSLKKKVKIIIWDSLENYRNNLEPYLRNENREYKEWMIADTFDGNINMLSITIVKSIKDRADYSLDEFLENIAHELVHICHREIEVSDTSGWVYEMLATTLGDEKNHEIVPISVNLNEFEKDFDNIDNNYNIAYTVGKYLLEKYGKEYLYNLISNSNNLKARLPVLFEESKEWSISKRR